MKRVRAKRIGRRAPVAAALAAIGVTGAIVAVSAAVVASNHSLFASDPAGPLRAALRLSVTTSDFRRIDRMSW